MQRNDKYLAADRFEETAHSVPMSRNWQDLARSYRPIVETEEAAVEPPACLPRNHPGVKFAFWRGWLIGKLPRDE